MKSKDSNAPEYYSYSDLPEGLRYLYEIDKINIIPITKKSKKAAISWKQYQHTKFPLEQLKNHRGNFGLITGSLSPRKGVYITVIDLDDPKLFKHFQQIDTLQVKTPRKGYQIIICSKSQTNDKNYFKREYKLEIEILDTEKWYTVLPPSYVEYRDKGELIHTGIHEQITKLDLNQEEPLLLKVEDAKSLVESILTKAGFKKKDKKNKKVKDDVKDIEAEIVKILKEGCPKEGRRQDYAMCTAGTLKQKAGFTESAAKNIVRSVFTDEVEQRLSAVTSTYAKDSKKLKGWSCLQGFLTGELATKFLELIKDHSKDLKTQITNKLLKHQEPTVKMLTDYLSMNLDLYKNLNTRKFYERQEDGSYHEIDSVRPVEFFNDEFGVDTISQRKANQALQGITNPIYKDYNLIEFKNGILNTKTKKFTNDKSFLNKVPKLTLPFKWNPQARGGKLKKVIDETLNHPDYHDNKILWFRAVGHMFMGINTIGKHVIVVGPSKSGKSTLSTILKRLLNYSSLTVVEICRNERFTLYTMIDKDINIDDDINNGILKNIGFLNRVTTGNGMEVEVKGENKRINAENPQIPRLYSNGNSLPPVLGEGFNTRILLIHAPNIKTPDEREESLQPAILVGEYDEELEWLVYQAINIFWDNMKSPMTSTEVEDEMMNSYELHSYPVKVAIEALFEVDWDGGNTIEVKEVNRCIKKWCKIRYKEGKISKEHRAPGNTKIRRAMDRVGYDQKVVNYRDEVESHSVRSYVDIKKTRLCEEIEDYKP